MVEYGIVGLLILVAVIHLFRRMARSAGGPDDGCGVGCGCGGSSRLRTDRLGKRIDLIQLDTTPDPDHKKAT